MADKADSTILIPKDQINSDKGRLVITVTSDPSKKTMKFEFNTPISWVEFARIDAVDFANAFLSHIKRIQTVNGNIFGSRKR